jgi:hypothetical protein
MKESDLTRLERDVQEARAKVVADLAVLTAPQTVSGLRETVEAEASATKDRLLEAGREKIQSRVDTLIQTMKAKAAANPLAVAAIGAGVAYRLYRHPPVASVLVGAGLYSFLTTDSRERPFLERHGLEEAAETLKGRMREVKEVASETTTAAVEKTKEWVEHARSTGAELVADASDRIGETTQHLSRLAEGSPRITSRSTGVADEEAKDRLLLGIAGLAVAAALGMAMQRRSAEHTIKLDQAVEM